MKSCVFEKYLHLVSLDFDAFCAVLHYFRALGIYSTECLFVYNRVVINRQYICEQNIWKRDSGLQTLTPVLVKHYMEDIEREH